MVKIQLLRHPPKINPLTPFPRLDTREEQDRLDDNNNPLPRDTDMSEDSIVQDGDVECGEDSDETRDDRPEQELVAPDIDGPLREILCGFGLHAEEGAAHVDHLPG